MGNDIQQHFQNIHTIIRQGKTRALAAATFHALETYWNVGAYLQHRLNEHSYGKKIVGELGEWLQTQEPGLKGFDRRSLYRMREFFEAWADADWEIAGLSKNQNMNPSIVLFEE